MMVPMPNRPQMLRARGPQARRARLAGLTVPGAYDAKSDVHPPPNIAHIAMAAIGAQPPGTPSTPQAQALARLSGQGGPVGAGSMGAMVPPSVLGHSLNAMTATVPSPEQMPIAQTPHGSLSGEQWAALQRLLKQYENRGDVTTSHDPRGRLQFNLPGGGVQPWRAPVTRT